MRELLERRWRAGIGLKRILIAGSGELGRSIADKILEHRELGYQIVGFVDDRAAGDHLGYRGLPLLGTLEEAAEVTQREAIDHLYVALPPEQHLRMIELIESTSREMVDVKVVPDLLQVIALRARLEDLDGVPVINVNDVPLQGFNSVVKRAIDIAISFAALAVLAIPLGVIALLVRLSSHGPVFYRQERMGLDGKPFTIVKFRSMHDDAEKETGPVWAQKDDPRVTALGQFLRRSNLDELPQLWNVLTRRDVDRRPAARAAALRRAVQAPDPPVHVAAQGEGGAHRLGAGERLARQHAAREADRVRPLLHRELVGAPRCEDHVADDHQRLLPQARVLTRGLILDIFQPS